MRSRGRLTAAALAVAVLGAAVAGCTAAPRAHDGPMIIPHGMSWQYAVSCIQSAGQVSVAAMEWSNEGAYVELDESTDPALDIPSLELQIEACLTAHRYEERSDAFVDPYERERLWENYTMFVLPCLSAEGIEVAPRPRAAFMDPAGGEPWNPYYELDLPFDRLIELYDACPPRPATLSEADLPG